MASGAVTFVFVCRICENLQAEVMNSGSDAKFADFARFSFELDRVRSLRFGEIVFGTKLARLNDTP